MIHSFVSVDRNAAGIPYLLLLREVTVSFAHLPENVPITDHAAVPGDALSSNATIVNIVS
jgi:hypothetical protein